VTCDIFSFNGLPPSLRKEKKNEGLIRSISGNSNIPVVYQFYKLENSHPMHIDVDKTKPPKFF